MPSKILPVILAAMLMIFPNALRADEPWRSSLYPQDWKPGFTDASGHSLQDFSYAGYHSGEKALRQEVRPGIDVTQAPYLADPKSGKDATAAIQAALDAAATKGGGDVYLPPGTYLLSPPEGQSAILRLEGDNVVLRGAGPDKTFLFCTSTTMREKQVIRVRAKNPADWIAEKEHGPLLTADVPTPTRTLPVADTAGFAVGDLVTVRNDLTQHFIDYLGMGAKWIPAASPNRTLCFCRRITALDPGRRTLTVDVPVRGLLFTADNARVVKTPGHLIAESGLEDFSLGMKQHPGTGLDDDETKNTTPGTTAYDIHDATAIQFERAENCWMRRVNSYCPPGNDPGVNVLSHGVKLTRTRLVTVQDCDWRHTQYKGGGGNGYLYTIHGNDNLIIHCRAEDGRHNFSFGTMSSSGNVIYDFHSKDGRLASDFHMFLSMANLLDDVVCDRDSLEAQYRPYGGTPEHGVTTTQSVFWNTHGEQYVPSVTEYAGKPSKRTPYLVVSKQFGNGYVIGTQGPAYTVDSTNFVEGVSKGATLAPASLYLDQVARRLHP